MKKSMKRYLAMLLAVTLVLQQGGTITLADENEPASETVVEKTTEAQVTEKQEEKKPEISEPKQEETKAPEAKPEAPNTEENKTPETKPEETNAPDTQTETQKDETAAEPESSVENATEQTTETEAVTEGASEGETQTPPEQEKESEQDSEPETEQKEEEQLEASVMQEVFRKTVDDTAVPMVKYTVKVTNKAEKANAEDATLKVLLADALSYKKEEGETPELVSFENLGKAIEAAAFEGEELNEEQKAAYANGNVVLWKDQTIAAGAEKTFVFCAEVKDGQTDVNALKNLWLVNGEAVADEKIQWANTELLKAEEELPTEFTYEDDDMIVTATLAEGTVLPEGARFVVVRKELTDEEKALIEEQLGENAASYGYAAYDMHFEVDGGEIEPENGNVSVAVQYKRAVQFATEKAPVQKTEEVDAAVKSGLVEFVTPDVPAEAEKAEYKVLHFDENADSATVEDVTNAVDLADNGEIAGVGFTTDSFSTIAVISEPTIVSEESAIEINARVNLKGKEMKAGDYSFRLINGGNNAVKDWNDGEQEVVNGEDGSITFTVNLSDGKGVTSGDHINGDHTHKYLLKQKRTSLLAGLELDLREYMFIVDVKRQNDQKQISVKCVLYKDAEGKEIQNYENGEEITEIVFENTYKEAKWPESDYTLEKFLNGYNIFTFGDAEVLCHTVGGFLVGGNLTAGNYFVNHAGVPCYVAGKATGLDYGDDKTDTQNALLYLGSKNELEFNEQKVTKINETVQSQDIKKHIVFNQDEYLDFSKAKTVIDSTLASLSAAATVVRPDANGKIIIPAGTNVVIESLDGVTGIEVSDGGTDSNTIITVKGDGAITLPGVDFKNFPASGDEHAEGMSLVWAFPEATGLCWTSSPWYGHIVAPNADITTTAGGNYNGAMLGKTVKLGGGNEGHWWPYRGPGLTPTDGEFQAAKTVDGETPSAKTTFTFTMEEIQAPEEAAAFGDDGEGNVRTRTSNGQKIDFGSVLYTVTGDYYYLIKETDPLDGKYIYDSKEYIVKVVVTSSTDASGKIAYSKTITYYQKVESDAEGATELLTYNGEKIYGVRVEAAEGKKAVTFDNKELTSKEVQKVWVGDDEDVRPDSIQVQLKKNGTAYGAPVTLNSANSWSYTWENLPKKENGADINYTVEEVGPVFGYTSASTVSGDKTTITNTYQTVSKSVEKVWVDGEDQDGLRPDSIQVQLKADEAPYGDAVTLNKKNGWKHDWKDLPKVNATTGEDITYTVEEVGTLNGYTSASTVVGDKTTITNTHAPEEVSAQVKKVWDDDEDRDSKRPGSIEVTLYADGDEKTTVTLDESNDWTSDVITGLAKNKKNADGTVSEIVYTWEEEDLQDGYTLTGTSTEGILTTLTNTYAPEEVSAQVKKVWNDAGDRDGKRPDSIDVTLYADGEEHTTVTLNEANHWTSEIITGLPKNKRNADGSLSVIKYTWGEKDLPDGYKLTGTSRIGILTTLTNTYAPEEVSAQVKKVWDDAEDRDGKRPDSIKVTLYADGDEKATVTLDESNDWTSDVITGLAKNKENADGTVSAIEYTWEEEDLPEGYTLTDNSTEGTVTTLTNTYAPEEVSAQVKKVWDDAEDRDGKRPDSIKVTLLADGDEKTTVTLNESNDWTSDVITGLAKNKKNADGTVSAIEYTWEEKDLPEGYTLTDKSTEGILTTLTNTHDIDKTSKEVEKIWVDGENEKNLRPEKIVVQLLADGAAYGDPVELKAENGWKKEWKELPKKAAGKDVVYTVEEISNVPGYTTTYATDETTGKVTITNTITSVKVSKVDVADSKELAGAHIQILDKDGEVVEEWDSTTETHEVKGLKTGETYTLKETLAPDGYTVTAETTFTLSEDGTIDSGKTTTKSENGVLLVEDSLNRISIEKVDENGAALAGAKLVIKDAAGNVVGEPWITDGKAHEITGLAKGSYTLSELEAPRGYQVSLDKSFVITGEETDADMPIKVEMKDEKIVESRRSLRVTKELSMEGISEEAHIIVREAAYNVALFADEARTERVTDVKKIVFANQESSYVTFDNLEADKTYYIGETDEYGTVIPSGHLTRNLIYYPTYDNNSTFKFEGDATEGVAGFTNVYVEWPDYFYLSGQLTVTKQVLLNGEESDSNDVFYARVFKNAALTDPVSSEVLVLNMAGGSKTSVTVTNLPIGDTPESSMKYYVAETDANGNPLDPAAITEYTISIDKSEITLNASNANPEVVITNDFHEEESEFESESETEEVDEKKTAPKTGDDTNFMKYLLLMALSAGLGAVAVDRKRRKAKRVRK